MKQKNNSVEITRVDNYETNNVNYHFPRRDMILHIHSYENLPTCLNDTLILGINPRVIFVGHFDS